ncbi:MAG: hypothetical protein Q8Q31_00555 [Nanoarchaeota archaeon]|nr:hypothetical protein [Nanoarchaeota archaeon]
MSKKSSLSSSIPQINNLTPGSADYVAKLEGGLADIHGLFTTLGNEFQTWASTAGSKMEEALKTRGITSFERLPDFTRPIELEGVTVGRSKVSGLAVLIRRGDVTTERAYEDAQTDFARKMGDEVRIYQDKARELTRAEQDFFSAVMRLTTLDELSPADYNNQQLQLYITRGEKVFSAHLQLGSSGNGYVARTGEIMRNVAEVPYLKASSFRSSDWLEAFRAKSLVPGVNAYVVGNPSSHPAPEHLAAQGLRMYGERVNAYGQEQERQKQDILRQRQAAEAAKSPFDREAERLHGQFKRY